MWQCPNCGAINYSKGPCECCGYGGVQVSGGSASCPEYTPSVIAVDKTKTGDEDD